jgi:nitrous oxidase accessory protein
MLVLLLALTAGQSADTLRLAAGVHPGPLVIERPTIVLGDSGAVVRGEGRGSVVVIRAGGRGSIIRGLRIEHSGRTPETDDAGVMVAADSVVLEDLIIRDILFGVYLRQVRGAVVRRVDIEGPRGLRESAMADGITLYNSPGAVAEYNRIAYVRDGIYFSYSDSVRVRDNRVSHVRFGLHYMFSHQNRFERNVFTDNAAGAVIMNSRGVVVVDNVFAWNAGSRSYGLVLQAASDPVVTGNLLVGNGIGVFFDNVIRGTFTGNVVAGNWLGLQLFANSENTRLTGNAIAANTFDVSGGAGDDSYLLCVDGRGNYWAAAAAGGYDLDGDGVLDAPHAASSPIAELAQGRAGLRLFLESPAASAVGWAERSFPVFDVAGPVDSCPLAAPPEPAMLARMPVAPAGEMGGRGGQQAAGALVAGAGLMALGVLRRKSS